ncbi:MULTISPECIES: Mu-like prophage major head subunit gpT family protein [unclassified Sphingomonas]|uniref:Mu-like prophage major head subunit gpT family protein n=1 Tax=unclassified Sphingomonas TaxID=196159 RepID=UPI00082BAE28|nr:MULTISPECIES: Mu-like prophage major head subunit gpT family protein [unclassified Sphingomonas]
MIINTGNLKTLGIGYKAAFQRGLDQAVSQRAIIATTVPSSTGSEEYGWLGKAPNMREWLGDRVVQNMAQHDYTIKNRDWELTIGVGRNDIEDDNWGVYAPLMEEMGRSVIAHPDQLCFAMLKAGFTTPCYDGQFFFDTDHPVLDELGAPTTVANTDGGAGTPWFLIDDTRALKPILFQERKKPVFIAKDNPEDERVFWNKEFIYGTDARYNVGFGFWQFAWGSRQTLNAANYATARASMMNMKGDYGRPLGVMPRLLVVPPALESAALKIVNNELGPNGETNEWKGTAKVEVVPWLA